MYRKNKSIFYLPPIKNKEQKVNLNQTRNKFHFYLRLSKPLKIVEPTKNYFDNSLILTKLQKSRLNERIKYEKLFKKQNANYFNNSSSNINKYKNMIPIKIWKKWEHTYDNCKKEFNSLNKIKAKEKLFVNNNKSKINLKVKRNKNISFVNQGLNKFIESIEKSCINNSYYK